MGLLRASLQRYARVVVVVEGLEDAAAAAAAGGVERREAVGKVEALHGASVVASRGWKDAADRVQALVRREAAEGLGLAQEVSRCCYCLHIETVRSLRPVPFSVCVNLSALFPRLTRLIPWSAER